MRIILLLAVPFLFCGNWRSFDNPDSPSYWDASDCKRVELTTCFEIGKEDHRWMTVRNNKVMVDQAKKEQLLADEKSKQDEKEARLKSKQDAKERLKESLPNISLMTTSQLKGVIKDILSTIDVE